MTSQSVEPEGGADETDLERRRPKLRHQELRQEEKRADRETCERLLVDVAGLCVSAGRIPVKARGTGCRLASAIAAGLARGTPVREAVIDARRYVREYLQAQIPV